MCIRDRLKEKGVSAVQISLDDFFMGEGKAPILDSGEYDYEDIRALNLEQVENCLLDLSNRGYCKKPTFDFEKKRPMPEITEIQLPPGGIAIVEGIHALNPLVTAHLPEDKILKMYVSVKQGIKDGDEVILSPRNLRSVSYTHLMRFSVTPEEFPYQPGDILDLAVTLERNEYRGEASLSIHIRDLKLHGVDAVSYTHLDVYKRQL